MFENNANLYTKKQLLVFAGAGLVLLALLVIALGAKSNTPNMKDGSISIMTSSPLTGTSQTVTIRSVAVDPHAGVTRTDYQIYGLPFLPLSKVAQSDLRATLPGYVREYLQPAYQNTYIHIVKDTIKQASDVAYSFDFYVDSPESYFHFSRTGAAGSMVGNPVTQIPWEGSK